MKTQSLALTGGSYSCHQTWALAGKDAEGGRAQQVDPVKTNENQGRAMR